MHIRTVSFRFQQYYCGFALTVFIYKKSTLLKYSPVLLILSRRFKSILYFALHLCFTPKAWNLLHHRICLSIIVRNIGFSLNVYIYVRS